MSHMVKQSQLMGEVIILSALANELAHRGIPNMASNIHKLVDMYFEGAVDRDDIIQEICDDIEATQHLGD